MKSIHGKRHLRYIQVLLWLLRKSYLFTVNQEDVDH